MASMPPLPSLDDQRQFWDWHWNNWKERRVLNDWTERRAEEILGLIRGLGLRQPRLLDLGCGRGWFTERLAEFGETHGIDLSPEGIAAARERRPDIKYIAGNVYDRLLPEGYFDVVVSQEVIAHVEDQEKYLDCAADVLKPGGYLIITTGNKYVIDRLGDVGWVKQPPQHIRFELGLGELKRMLSGRFHVARAFTIIPQGKRGILRFVNSYKLNSMLRLVTTQEKIDALKEKAGFGWQMILLARKKA